MWKPQKLLLLSLLLFVFLPSFTFGQPSEPSLGVPELWELLQEYDRALSETEILLQRWIDRSTTSETLLQKMSEEVQNLQSLTTTLKSNEKEISTYVTDLERSNRGLRAQRGVLIGVSLAILILGEIF